LIKAVPALLSEQATPLLGHRCHELPEVRTALSAAALASELHASPTPGIRPAFECLL